MDELPQGIEYPWLKLLMTSILSMLEQNKSFAAAKQRPTEPNNGACVKGKGQNGSRTNITNNKNRMIWQ